MGGSGKKGKRRKGIYWEYNGDGRLYYEKIKGIWKKYWKRWKKKNTGPKASEWD